MLTKWVKLMHMRLWVLPKIHRTYRPLTVAEAFRKIYMSKAWGEGTGVFCSGTGSAGDAAEHYCENVVAFIRDQKIKSVLDLGCGDFSVGRKIVEATGVRYTGVDVVPELIDHHKASISDPRAGFICADITSDPLPHADLCLIRQVFQHLSNAEITKVLGNIGHLPRVLVSEDVPSSPKSFNRDKPHGPDVRAYYGSGVFLDAPPFSRPATELWSIGLRSDAVLRTFLLQPSIAMGGD
jgi:SAM-dependent methyltransferase